MKTFSAIIGLACAAMAPSAPAAFDLSWYTIAGGGGTGAGGGFALTSAIGHPTAGVIGSGTHAVEGGFLNQGVLEANEHPRISIEKAGPNLVLLWPRSAGAYRLEWSANPAATASWTQVPGPSATSATHIRWSEPALAGARFYRLRK